MRNWQAHYWTIYPENEWTVYQWTINKWYYKNPDKGIDSMLSEAESEARENEAKVRLMKLAEITTNAMRALWI
ncbi:MAG: hypothetical protein ACD_2C00073G0033 [uncultured bacterium (gcode 4)]|uniref:Uncharacterized protein n=1 Tax=uncultured bacterium (gcode 4) TaxID=1234023 RepID=K2H271_9BACT|nr:MAG: hypothetical protein ACD_2C00073G0033 [uncultured bacterium (gcode 4)]